MANAGAIGNWIIDSQGIVDTSGRAKIETNRTFGSGGTMQVLMGSAATSPNVETQIGSEVVAAKFKSTRNYANGFNVAVRAEASGGLGGGKAIDAIGNVDVSKNLYVGEVATFNGGIKVGSSQQPGLTTSVLAANGITINFKDGILVSVTP